MAVEYDVIFAYATRYVIFRREIDGLENVARDFGAFFQTTGQFDDGFLAHAIDEQVGTCIAKDTLLELVLPVVIVCQSA